MQSGSAKWMELIKLDCLAVIRARCGQGPRHGGPNTSAVSEREKERGEGPQLDDL